MALWCINLCISLWPCDVLVVIKFMWPCDDSLYIRVCRVTTVSFSYVDFSVQFSSLWYACRDGRVMGIVEVSRSIGDGRFKHCGVISTPDVFRTQLTENDLWVWSLPHLSSVLGVFMSGPSEWVGDRQGFPNTQWCTPSPSREKPSRVVKLDHTPNHTKPNPKPTP